jgi:heavy metal sensor kinase
MRSIRLTLAFYFVGLLTVALGVASWLVYQMAQRNQADKERMARKLLNDQYDKEFQAERQHLDNALLTKAQGLVGRVQLQLHWSRLRHSHLNSLGILSTPGNQNGYLLIPVWLGLGTPGPLSWELYRRNVADLQLPEPQVPLPVTGGDYYQIDSNYFGVPLRSASLGRLSFPDPQGFARGSALHSEFDDFPFTEGKTLRRVRLKASSTKRVSIWPDRPRRPRPRGNAEKPTESPAPAVPNNRPPRWVEPPLEIYVQVAADTNKLDAELLRLAQERDVELAGLKSATAASLAKQRNQLFLISSITFVSAALGALGLVWLGLLPLRHLSEAVSKVSPRDFHLPIDEKKLPRELRPITQRLIGALDLLKRAFSREKQATADISHELRTPLAALLTTTSLALRKTRSAEEYREMLQDCHLSAQQLNQIVERLLTLARLDAGVDLVRPQPVDAGTMAEQCAAVVRPLAEARGLALAVHTEGAARLTTDPDKLREVMTNLLHNAIQYNRPQGRVDLTVVRENGHLEVAVRDTGIGITDESKGRLFERFFRADPSRGADELHAGLGLAIVKEYVDLMGGKISVESTLGQGSTFRVNLPAA